MRAYCDHFLGIAALGRIAFVLFAFVSAGASAQGPSILWQRLLGGSLDDFGWDLVALPDGSLVGLAEIQSDDGDITGFHPGGVIPTDAWMFKLSPTGDLVWQIALGGNDGDGLIELIPTDDGGFVGYGATYSTTLGQTGTHGDQDLYVAKVSAQGQLLWERVLGGSAFDGYISSTQWSAPEQHIIETSDGGLLLAAWTHSNNGDVSGLHSSSSDAWVVKLDADGNTEWQRCLGGTSYEQSETLIELDSGELAILATTASNDGDVTDMHGAKDLWVVLLEPNGDLIWQRALGGTGEDTGYAMRKTLDGGILVSGAVGSNDGDVVGSHDTQMGFVDGWVVKLSIDGEIEWQRAIGGTGSDWATHLNTDNPDGSSLVVLLSTSTNGDFSGFASHKWTKVVKLDGDGEILWATGAGNNDGYESLSPVFGPNGDCTILRTIENPGGDLTEYHGLNDAWLIHFTPEGVFDWERCLGGSLGEWGKQAVGFGDGRIAFTGWSESADGDLAGFDPDHPNLWVVVLGEDSHTAVPDVRPSALKVWPVPSSGDLNVTLPAELLPCELRIVDGTGRTLLVKGMNTAEARLDLACPSGIYALELRHQGGIERRTVVVH